VEGRVGFCKAKLDVTRRVAKLTGTGNFNFGLVVGGWGAQVTGLGRLNLFKQDEIG